MAVRYLQGQNKKSVISIIDNIASNNIPICGKGLQLQDVQDWLLCLKAIFDWYVTLKNILNKEF